MLYAPDFIANAGGLINIAVELEGYDPRAARRRVGEIEETMAGGARSRGRGRRDAARVAPHALARARLRAGR